ncbi:HU family DNA-binding protein [Polaribacter marinivivus]|uniref:HU family DNA-binding protein n=1 Tax=Polaribacter marinivivus TaxID=1524260 RepID=A0ABV8R5K2_9FLAO
MISLNIIERPNPQDRTAENKFYAQVVATGKTDLERLAYLVSNQSTVREADCYAVILSLLHNIVDELKQGRIVKLDKLGAFQLGIQSEGVATAEEVTASVVKNLRIKFRPDQRMKNQLNLKTVQFTLAE